MINGEREYIILCKKMIEEKFHFGNGNAGLPDGQGKVRQRDLEGLADTIEEKSGIKLSLSTLKRLWKEDFDQTPHPSTLQALVSILGYKDWQDFKMKESLLVKEELLPAQTKPKSNAVRWALLSLILIIPVLIWVISFKPKTDSKKKPIIKGPVTFDGNKTVAQGVPSTIIFNYDVSNVEADSFFLQQSWNDQEKVRLDPKQHYYSSIYLFPGFHRAKLIANDSIIKRVKVHIMTDGWLPATRETFTDNRPVYLKKDNLVKNGSMHLVKDDLIASGVKVENNYILSYYNIRDFGNLSSDNFSVETKFRVDNNEKVVCPGFELVIATEENIFFVRLMGRGCERDAGIKMGENFREGLNSDLSVLGRNLHEWQNLKIKVINKTATVYFDDLLAYTLSFKQDFGKIVGLTYNFNSPGEVDYVRLRDPRNVIVYEDNFDKTNFISGAENKYQQVKK
jgi:hypothetical protein